MCVKKINSKEELLAYYESVKHLMDVRNFLPTTDEKFVISVCAGPGCDALGAYQIVENLNAAIKEKKLEKKVEVSITGCFGFCAKGPIVKIYPDDVFYIQVSFL